MPREQQYPRKINARVSTATWTALEKYATDQGRPVGVVVRELLEFAFEGVQSD